MYNVHVVLGERGRGIVPNDYSFWYKLRVCTLLIFFKTCMVPVKVSHGQKYFCIWNVCLFNMLWFVALSICMISQKTFLHGGHATLRVTKHCNNNGRANIEITLTKHSLLHTMSQVLKFNGLLHYCFFMRVSMYKDSPRFINSEH